LKITTLGVILALKNMGTWLMTTWQFEAVREDPALFIWGFLIFALINIPSDLFLANHLTDQAVTKALAEKDGN